MNRYAIMSALRSTPFAMLPERFAGMMERVLSAELEDERPALEAVVTQPKAGPDAKVSGVKRVSGSIAVLPIFGVIEQRRSWYSDIGADAVGSILDDLMANDSIGAVVLNIDSPGGSVSGIPELGDKIRGYRDTGSKPVYAIANSMAASAAYWIGSQATKLFVTPSGEVGSIGVWSMHQDVSGWLEKLGVNVTLISAGKYKVEGHPFAPLEEEARAAIQADVDHYYGMFLDAVAKGRGVSAKTVKNDFGEGRMIQAEEAVRRGMTDGVATLGELLGAIVKPRDSRQKALALEIAIAEEEAA